MTISPVSEPNVSFRTSKRPVFKPFGEDKWNKYFGDIGRAPPIPSNIENILNSPCPFNPRKSVRDTHVLILIPETVDGRPLNLHLLGELVSERDPEIHYCCCNANKENPAPASHWLLMTKSIVSQHPHSYLYATESELPSTYRKPTVLEAAATIFLSYVDKGIFLFSGGFGSIDPCEYTLTQEGITVGHFTIGSPNFSTGLRIGDPAIPPLGIVDTAGVRIFPDD